MLEHLPEVLQDLLSDVDIQSSDVDFDNLINSLAAQGVDLTQYTVDEIKEALDYALSIDGEINQECTTNSSGQPHAVSFGNSNNSQQIASLERELRDANHNIDYYEREIRNFTEKTSATYRSTCTSALNNATQKAANVMNKIQQLKK